MLHTNQLTGVAVGLWVCNSPVFQGRATVKKLACGLFHLRIKVIFAPSHSQILSFYCFKVRYMKSS